MAKEKVYSSVIDSFLDDREPNWEDVGLKDAVKSGEEQLDRTHDHVDEGFLDEIAEGASHHTPLPPDSKSATFLNRMSEKEAAAPRLSAHQPAKARVAMHSEDYQNDTNDQSIFDEVTATIEKAERDADPDNIEKRNQTDAEVKGYIHKLLNQGTAPSRVAALLEKVAEIELYDKLKNMGGSYLNQNAGLLGFSYLEPNTFMDKQNPSYEHEHTASDEKPFCSHCNKKVTAVKRDAKEYCPDCARPIVSKPKTGAEGKTALGGRVCHNCKKPIGRKDTTCPSCGKPTPFVDPFDSKTRQASSADCVRQFNAWKAAGIQVRAHSVKKITACNDCTFFKNRTCNLYHLPVVASAAELRPIINKLTAGVPAEAKRAALIRLANREPMRKNSVVKARPQERVQKLSQRTVENLREMHQEAGLEFTADAVETMHKRGLPLGDIYKKGSAKVGSVKAGWAIKAFIASLKERGTKIALSQIDCTLLKQKLGVANAIIGAVKCADCIYRQDMHCGLTGGTLLTFPGMEKMGKAASAPPTDARTLMREYEMVNMPQAGDIEMKEPERLEVEMGSSMSAGDL